MGDPIALLCVLGNQDSHYVLAGSALAFSYWGILPFKVLKYIKILEIFGEFHKSKS